ncbi:methyltransferase domain-containing protein [Aliarcobacter butzleri]|uniref:class I SAM-dependent methyltransferase n=1 Tax=Aliarcobacter butzleri TaxID=28197 RepID=UPI00263F11A7|nr:methyltransferase domain-containing protein [Aliarcobacter butzleri]MDN5126836.1 methyltransferase domain-containing protein [Aliarcobacter butzleri]
MEVFQAKQQVNSENYTDLSKINMINMYNLYYEIKDITNLLPKGGEILHVGVGTDLLTPILRDFGYKVFTMDIIEDLSPDYVGSLHELGKVTNEKKFDLVVCSHILEHIPYELFEKNLDQLKKYSKYTLIYLPNSGIALGAELRLHPKWRKMYRLFFPIFKNKKIKFNGEHYWEIDLKGTHLNKVRNDIKKYFNIIKEYRNEYWDNSYNFVLES